jgi:hypothetical protein
VESRTRLPSNAVPVPRATQGRWNPFECFRPIAKTISSRPAATTKIVLVGPRGFAQVELQPQGWMQARETRQQGRDVHHSVQLNY